MVIIDKKYPTSKQPIMRNDKTNGLKMNTDRVDV